MEKTEVDLNITPAKENAFPFHKELGQFILPFITGHVNVLGDGNCGFRTISYFQYGDQTKWVDIRQDLIEELTTNKALHLRALGGSHEEYENVVHRLSWFQTPAPEAHWCEVMTLGLVVATKYQKVFAYWSQEGYCTFLPLESRVGHDPPREYIHMARVCNGSHFIALHMRDDHPLPPIFHMWKTYHDPSIGHWPETVFHRQLAQFNTLRPTTSKHVNLGD